MAHQLEAKKLKSGVQVQVDNDTVTHLRTVDGGGIHLPQVNVTTTKSANVEHTVGRIHYDELEITFANAASNLPVVDKCCKYMNNPMKSPRMTLTVSELKRGEGTDRGGIGYQTVYYDCFPTEIELPKGTNDAGILETRIRFSLHRADAAAGGIAS
jgi:hypothetical protein